MNASTAARIRESITADNRAEKRYHPDAVLNAVAQILMHAKNLFCKSVPSKNARLCRSSRQCLVSLVLTDHFFTLPSRRPLELDILDGMRRGLVLVLAVVRVRVILLVEIALERLEDQSRDKGRWMKHT